MGCEVEFTDDFGDWWSGLNEKEQDSVSASVTLLEEYGANLAFPYCSNINNSEHSHMRELRI